MPEFKIIKLHSLTFLITLYASVFRTEFFRWFKFSFPGMILILFQKFVSGETCFIKCLVLKPLMRDVELLGSLSSSPLALRAEAGGGLQAESWSGACLVPECSHHLSKLLPQNGTVTSGFNSGLMTEREEYFRLKCWRSGFSSLFCLQGFKFPSLTFQLY